MGEEVVEAGSWVTISLRCTTSNGTCSDIRKTLLRFIHFTTSNQQRDHRTTGPEFNPLNSFRKIPYLVNIHKSLPLVHPPRLFSKIFSSPLMIPPHNLLRPPIILIHIGGFIPRIPACLHPPKSW